MRAVDFEYDGRYLSDYGFIICDFDNGSNVETLSAGSKITFNKVARNRGKIYSLSGTKYDECVSTEFSICKNPCANNGMNMRITNDDMRITNDEYRDIMRWLNRNEFLKFRLINDEDDTDDAETCYYEGSFSVDKIIIEGNLYGLKLTMETNRPFGYGQMRYVSWNITDTSKQYILSDISDEIGYIYPFITVRAGQDGDLSIHNETENCMMTIKNCTEGEVLFIDCDAKIITSSIESHKLYNDFNFEFFRIGNTIDNRNNYIDVSIPCTLSIRYTPVIKDAPN